jgi:hypothetical protein
MNERTPHEGTPYGAPVSDYIDRIPARREAVTGPGHGAGVDALV